MDKAFGYDHFLFFFFFFIGSSFTSKHLSCFSTTDKGKMTSTVVSKQNASFFLSLMGFYFFTSNILLSYVLVSKSFKMWI